MTHNTPEVPTPEPTIPLLCLKSGIANKLGRNGHGEIHYEILTNTSRKMLFLRLTQNTGGGNHSQELVPFSRAQAVVASIPPDAPIPSRVFRSCFKGRSQNNAGFYCLALRAEGLLAPVEGNRYAHQLAGDWENWVTQTLALNGEPVDLPVSLAGETSAEESTAPSQTRRGKRKIAQGETDDACAAH